MKPKLSICIPTYNRAGYLSECLNSVLIQSAKYPNVEIIVIDNASTDNTRHVVAELMQNCSSLKYHRNEENLGYTGNQIKCIEYASGQYLALLCDDDAYTRCTLREVFQIIDNAVEYSFLALNYYSFLNNIAIPYKSNYAPDNDVVFRRAYDIMNHPSVGHFSGFILNARIAKETLEHIFQSQSIEKYERMRGIISDVVHRGLSSTKLPAYFIGKRLLATRIPKQVDYDMLYHQCLDYYEYFSSLYQEGLITKSDLHYRAELVLSRLPKAIVADGYKLSASELANVERTLFGWFSGNSKFDLICVPLLKLTKFRLIRLLFRELKHLYKSFRSMHIRLQG